MSQNYQFNLIRHLMTDGYELIISRIDNDVATFQQRFLFTEDQLRKLSNELVMSMQHFKVRITKHDHTLSATSNECSACNAITA